MVNTAFSGQLKKVSLGIHHSLTAAVCAVLKNWDEQDCVEHTEEIKFSGQNSPWQSGFLLQLSFNKDMFCSV